LGAMDLLLRETNERNPLSLRRNVGWAISNLCRGQPAPPFDYILPAIPVLANLLNKFDHCIIMDACWSLSHISDDGDEHKINSILQAGVCQTVVRLLSHTTNSVQTPALRVIKNIVSGDEFQTQVAISSGCLPALKVMLHTSTKQSIKRDVCHALSNITAGNHAQIQAVLDAGIVDLLIDLMKNSQFDVRKEATHAIANLTCKGTASQVAEVVDKGCIELFCELLVAAPSYNVIAVCLESLENILRQGDQGVNDRPYAQMIKDTVCSFEELLETLCKNPNRLVVAKAQSLMEIYCSSHSLGAES